MDKSVVTISRLWHEPQIHTLITHEGIRMYSTLDDFITAVKHEIGSVAMTFRKATFEKQLDEAVKRVLQGIKDESAKVV